MFAIPEDKNRFAFSKWMAIATALLSLLLILWITNNDTTATSQSDATDTVFEADIKQTVVAFGQLKPKLRQGVIAMTAGNIAEIRVKSGDYVKKNQVLFRLINTQVESDLANRKLLLLQEKAHLQQVNAELGQKIADQQAVVDLAAAELNVQRAEFEANLQLMQKDIISALAMKKQENIIARAKVRLALEQQKLATQLKSNEFVLQAAQYALEAAQVAYQQAEEQFANLEVKADMAGILSSVDSNLEIGQHLIAGSSLGLIIDNSSLYAELKISATDSDKVRLGHQVDVNLRGVTVVGHVTQISPSVEDGFVRIDTEFEQVLPSAALPYLDVTANVVVFQAHNALVVNRRNRAIGANQGVTAQVKAPHQTQFNQRVVKVGVTTKDFIQLLGVSAGDQIILADKQTALQSQTNGSESING